MDDALQPNVHLASEVTLRELLYVIRDPLEDIAKKTVFVCGRHCYYEDVKCLFTNVLQNLCYKQSLILFNLRPLRSQMEFCLVKNVSPDLGLQLQPFVHKLFHGPLVLGLAIRSEVP